METKSNKGMKGIITLAVVFVLCIALVLATTLGDLSAKKTATGTIKFLLADYNFTISTEVKTETKIYPNNKEATTGVVELVNGHNNAGATAGLQPVYVRIKFTNIKIGDTAEFNKNIKAEKNETTGKVLVTADDVKDMLEISIDTSETKWGILSNDSTGYVYLVTDAGAATTLASTATNANAKATVKFNVSGIAPTGVTNGFNAVTSNGATVGLQNKYQGQTVSIAYTVEWGTTIDNIGKKTTTA